MADFTAVQAALANAATINANSSASASSVIPALQAASSAAMQIVANSDATISVFDVAASGGSVSVFQFTTGLAAWKDALCARAQASQAASLANTAIFQIQNGF